jgi:outer membrane protein assembly factor BamA
VNNRVQFVLRDPYLFNRRLDSLVSVFRTHEVRDSFTLNEFGTTLQVSHKHGEKDRTIYRYIYKDDHVMDLQITPEQAGVETLRLSGLGGGYVHDSRDNFYNPRQGLFASADITAYGQAIGSQAAFLKFFAQASLFRRVPGDSVWAQSMRIGLGDPFGISESIPLSERFFAGGDTTVRGFRFDQLGPKDPVTGEPVGGETLFIVNEEFRFPIWRFLRGVVFFDAGNVTSQLSQFDPLDLRTVLGAGFRIDTPIGPVRFEYGWKLDRQPGESSGELHITIGQAF